MITNVNVRVNVSKGKLFQRSERQNQVGQGNYSFPFSWAAHHIQCKIPPSIYWADGFSPTCFCFHPAPEGSDGAVTLAGKMLSPSSVPYEQLVVRNTAPLSHLGFAACISRRTTNIPIPPHQKARTTLRLLGISIIPPAQERTCIAN